MTRSSPRLHRRPSRPARPPTAPASVQLSWAAGSGGNTPVSQWRLSIGTTSGGWSSSAAQYPGVGTFASTTLTSTFTSCPQSCVLKLEALGPGSVASLPKFLAVGPSDARPAKPVWGSPSRPAGTPSSVSVSWSQGTSTGTAVSAWRLSQNDGAGGWVVNNSTYPGTGANIGASTTSATMGACATSCVLKLEALGPDGTVSEPALLAVASEDGGSTPPSELSIPGVTNLSASWQNNEQAVQLTWQYTSRPTGTHLGFRVDIRVDGQWYPWGYRPYSSGVTTTGTSTTMPCVPGTECLYRVLAYGRETADPPSTPYGIGPSSQVGPGSHNGVPGAPTLGQPTGLSNDQGVQFSWTAPSSSTAIRGYRVDAEIDGQWVPWQYRPSASPEWSYGVTRTNTGPQQLPCVVSSAPGSCRFRVSAVNWVGVGSPSSPLTFTQTGVPGAPTLVDLVEGQAGSGYPTLSWTAPSSGTSIIGYQIDIGVVPNGQTTEV